jgi:predicted SAM-dependent methyltransferase
MSKQPDKAVCQSIADRYYNKYSQSGEDGILEEIFARIGTKNKWCFEAGAADGILFSNTRKLVEEGWTAILVEKDAEKFGRLQSNCQEYGEECICEFAELEPSGVNSLDSILRRHGAPKDIDLVVIDIDGQDFHVWNSSLTTNYQPRVVVIEHDPLCDEEFIPTVGGKGQAGRAAIERLVISKGYYPLVQPGSNTICIHHSIAHLLSFYQKFLSERDDGMIKLNLGAGERPVDGYTSIDVKAGQKIYPLHYPDNTVDVIRASHVLEHFSWKETADVLADWVDKLKIGGTLAIAVPDFHKVATNYLHPEGNEQKINTTGVLMGGQTDENDYHKAVFDVEGLTNQMKAAGLDNIQTWESETNDCAAYDISLNLMGTKTDKPRRPRHPKVGAVMSMGRLAMTDNMAAAQVAFRALEVDLDIGQGVYWGQKMTRIMEDQIEKGNDYIVTLDGDTWFLDLHVIELVRLMNLNPDIDALVPIQVKRNADTPLITPLDCDLISKDKSGMVGQARTEVFQKPTTAISTGHFGLSVIRVSSLKKFKKPWFVPIPDPKGGWGEGRVDEDIYFWNNLRDSDFKVCSANNVMIGHMQMLCTFPDTLENGWKPIHMYMNDLKKNGPPAHCIPQIEGFN